MKEKENWTAQYKLIEFIRVAIDSLFYYIHVQCRDLALQPCFSVNFRQANEKNCPFFDPERHEIHQTLSKRVDLQSDQKEYSFQNVRNFEYGAAAPSGILAKHRSFDLFYEVFLNFGMTGFI